MIVLNKILPNETSSSYHVAIQYEFIEGGAHTVVRSYQDLSLSTVLWEETYIIPLNLYTVFSLADTEKNLILPGGPFEGGTLVLSSITDMYAAKLQKWAEVKAFKEFLSNKGLDTPKGFIDSDSNSRTNILLAANSALKDPNWEAGWTFQDNSTVILNSEEILGISALLSNYLNQIHVRSQQIREAINLAKTKEELDNIDIHANWID